LAFPTAGVPAAGPAAATAAAPAARLAATTTDAVATIDLARGWGRWIAPDTDGRADWLLTADLALRTAAATQAIAPATAGAAARTAATQARSVATDVSIRINARHAVGAAREARGAAVRLPRAARVVEGAADSAAELCLWRAVSLRRGAAVSRCDGDQGGGCQRPQRGAAGPSGAKGLGQPVEGRRVHGASLSQCGPTGHRAIL
jgi:hypothetical protein